MPQGRAHRRVWRDKGLGVVILAFLLPVRVLVVIGWPHPHPSVGDDAVVANQHDVLNPGELFPPQVPDPVVQGVGQGVGCTYGALVPKPATVGITHDAIRVPLDVHPQPPDRGMGRQSVELLIQLSEGLSTVEALHLCLPGQDEGMDLVGRWRFQGDLEVIGDGVDGRDVLTADLQIVGAGVGLDVVGQFLCIADVTGTADVTGGADVSATTAVEVDFKDIIGVGDCDADGRVCFVHVEPVEVQVLWTADRRAVDGAGLDLGRLLARVIGRILLGDRVDDVLSIGDRSQAVLACLVPTLAGVGISRISRREIESHL